MCRKKGRKIKTVTVNDEAVAAVDEIDTGEAVIEIAATPVEEQPSDDDSSPFKCKDQEHLAKRKRLGKARLRKLPNLKSPPSDPKKLLKIKLPVSKKLKNLPKQKKKSNACIILNQPQSICKDNFVHPADGNSGQMA